MSTTAPAPSVSSIRSVLDRAAAAMTARRRAEVEVLESALAGWTATAISTAFTQTAGPSSALPR